MMIKDIGCWIGTAVLACGLAGASWADDLHQAETRVIARDFVQILFVHHDVKQAYAKYMTADFIQHNPEIANGLKGDDDFLEKRREHDPQQYLPVAQWRDVIDHVLVDDKMFAVHHHVYTSPTDRGRVFVDIWRTENGKLVEHWDVIQPVPEQPVNRTPMWGDMVKARPPGRGPASPEAVIRAYLKLGLEENQAAQAARQYISPAFIQHSPHIPPGKAALIRYFSDRYPPSDAATRTSSVSHILVDGDLVLLHRHVSGGPGDRGTVYADLFRVQDGQIVEHWDVIQPVPPTSVNGNTMW
jgi:predicted SnoaL-like aldol condensation-catalyzing enzyme